MTDLNVYTDYIEDRRKQITKETTTTKHNIKQYYLYHDRAPQTQADSHRGLPIHHWVFPMQDHFPWRRHTYSVQIINSVQHFYIYHTQGTKKNNINLFYCIIISKLHFKIFGHPIGLPWASFAWMRVCSSILPEVLCSPICGQNYYINTSIKGILLCKWDVWTCYDTNLLVQRSYCYFISMDAAYFSLVFASFRGPVHHIQFIPVLFNSKL